MLQAFIKDDFNNLLEYQQWVSDSMSHLSTRNRHHLNNYSKQAINEIIGYSPSWFGAGTTYEELKAGITTYKNPQLIEKIYNQVNETISLSVRDRIKAKKVNYNAMGLGVFLFDRAAMGMYRLKELYSPTLHKVVEREEVRKAGKGYELVSDGSPVMERWEQKPDGTPKIRTTSKKVYAYFPKRNKSGKAVEIYLAIGGASTVTAESFMYSGVSAIIVAQLLEQARISTKISIVIGTSPDNFQRAVYASIVPVKNYDEKTDPNLLALLSSDPRFYRFDGFKGVISTYEHFGAMAPDDLGYGFNDRNNLMRTIEQSSYSSKARLAPNRIYMGRIFSEQEAVRDIEDTIEQLAGKLNE